MINVQQHSSGTNSSIDITQSATKHFLSYLSKDSEYCGVRLSVKKSGCSGLSYVIDYVNSPIEDDIEVTTIGQYKVFIDKKSYPYLRGVQIDYVKEGLNNKMLFKNPNQTGVCGCGESFTID